MRLTAVLLLAASLHVAAKTQGQNITLKVTNSPMKEVFREIRKQTGLDVWVDEGLLEKTKAVTLDVHDMPVSDLLAICLRNEPLTYSIIDGRIIVKSITTPDLSRGVISPSSFPPIEIHGRITTVQNEPLSNANIIIKRTGTGTITNAKGEFSLNGLNAADEIIVSFIGYKTQKLKVGTRTEFVLFLEPATEDLDKVVVQGYGTTSQRLTTGNIATVKAIDIEKQPVLNPLWHKSASFFFSHYLFCSGVQ